MNYDDLAGSMKPIACIIGVDATVRLVEEYGGTSSSYVPVRARPDHPWVKLIGFELFTKLCEVRGGQNISFPVHAEGLGSKKQAIIELAERGLSANSIARQLGCSDRYVRKVLSDLKGED